MQKPTRPTQIEEFVETTITDLSAFWIFLFVCLFVWFVCSVICCLFVCMFCHLLFICSFVLFFVVLLFVCLSVLCVLLFFCSVPLSVCVFFFILFVFVYFVSYWLFCLFVCFILSFFCFFLYVPSVHRNWFNNVFVIPAHQFLRPWNLELMLTDTRWEFHKYLLEILFWLEGLYIPYLQYCVLFHP